MSENFCRKLREAAAARRITQTALAEQVGLTQSNVSDYMRGQFVPGVDMVERFAAALGVAPWNLLDDQPLKYLPLPTPESATAKRSKSASTPAKPAAPARAKATVSK